MPEITSVLAMIAAIKHSMDVVKSVKEADFDLDKAILKEKIAVLVDTLLEAKIQANETLDVIKEKETEISRLKSLLEFKSKLIREDGKYYVSDDEGHILDVREPLCSKCWDADQKAIHLTLLEGNNWFQCPNCKNHFGEEPQTSYDIYVS